MSSVARRSRAGWTFLTSHAVVLLMIRDNPAPRLTDLAEQAGVTQRTCQRIVNDLVTARYVTRKRVGRRNVYSVNEHLTLRLPAAGDVELKELLGLNIRPARPEDAQPEPSAPEDTGERIGRNPAEAQLRSAVEGILSDERAVYSVYQRIVRLKDRTTAGWEGLSRPRGWLERASVEGLFSTGQTMGVGRELDWQCRRTILRDAVQLAGPLFINISLANLIDPIYGVDRMESMCASVERSPESVVLELSEREPVPDATRLRKTMAEYRVAGFRFALDDIGEGHANLEIMVAARPEFLKLGRPLVMAAGEEMGAFAEARSVVTFAQYTGSTVIAEGVENEAASATCESLMVDQAQGWLFGGPQAADSLTS